MFSYHLMDMVKGENSFWNALGVFSTMDGGMLKKCMDKLIELLTLHTMSSTHTGR